MKREGRFNRSTCAVLLAVFLINSVQVHAGDVGYWPEKELPKFTTVNDYKKYEEARKNILATSIVGGIAAGVLLGYAHQVKRKADRVELTERFKVVDPVTGFKVFPPRPEQAEFYGRLKSKERAARTIGTVLSVLSFFGITASISIRF